MKNRELIELVEIKILDSSYSQPMILGRLNKGMRRVAAMVDLPLLKSSATIQTGTDAYVALPSSEVNAFHVDKERALIFVASQGQDKEINIMESWIKFLQKYPQLDEAYDVYDVCVKAQNLYYQGIPSTADSLDIHFYRKPVTMKDGTNDEPDGVPDHLQEDLLVNFAAWDIFKEIEQDISGRTPETDKHRNLFAGAIAELKQFVGEPDARPIHYEYDEGAFI